MSLIRLSIKRSGTDLAIFTALIAGTLLAATTLAAAPMYLRSVEQIAVDDMLEMQGTAGADFQVRATGIALSRTAFQDAGDEVRSASDENLGDLLMSSETMFRSPVLWLTGTDVGGPVRNSRQRVFLQGVSELGSHVRYVAGIPPGREVTEGDGIRSVEVSLVASAAADLGISVRDTLEISLTTNRLAPVLAVVTGLYEVIEPEDRYWQGQAGPLITPEPLVEFTPPPLVANLAEGTLFDLFAGGPATTGDAWWLLYTDLDEAEARSINSLNRSLDGFRGHIESALPARVFGGLSSPARDLERRLEFASVPLFLVGVMLLVLAAFFVVMLAGLFTHRRSGDAAALRGRGMSRKQWLHLSVFDAALLLVVPALLAVLLATVLVPQLGRLPAYQEVTGGDVLPVELSPRYLLWSAGGSVVPVAVLLLTGTITGMSPGTIGVRSQRSSQDRPIVQRFYLDIGFLLVGGVALWELARRDAFLILDSEGNESVGFLLILAPVIISIGVTIVLLRAMPPILTLFSLLITRNAPIWITIGTWHLSRRPFQHFWPLLLMAFSASTVVLAVTVAATLDAGDRDRILYKTAADVRLEGLQVSDSTRRELAQELGSLPGVLAVASAVRTTGRLGVDVQSEEFGLLMVEPQNFSEVSWYRSDFSSLSLSELSEAIKVPDPTEPTLLPAGTQEISIWVQSSSSVDHLALWVRLRDSAGRTQTLAVQPQSADGDWRLLAGSVDPGLAPPLELVSVLVYEPPTGPLGTAGDVMLDDLQAVAGDGSRTTVIAFDDLSGWAVLPTSLGDDTRLSVETGQQRTGAGQSGAIARLALGRGTDTGIRGVRRTPTDAAIPLVVSEEFVSSSGRRVGETFNARIFQQIVPVVIAAIVEYFPTLDPGDGPFAIADIDAVSEFLVARGIPQLGGSAEMFLSLEDSSSAAVLDEITAVVGSQALITDAETLSSESLVTPIAVAGWRGFGLVAAGLSAIFATAGIAAYLIIAIRGSRHDHALLTALGISRTGLASITAVEHLVMAAAGAVFGVIFGLVASWLAISALAEAGTGREPLPPYVTSTGWPGVAAVMAIVIAVAVATVLWLTVSSTREAISGVLRENRQADG